jgi:predicted NBD/HSP70 family sugar kinase
MTSAQPRHWRSAADALAVLRQQQRLTRPELGRRLGLDSGPLSDLVKRLSRAALISERRAAPDRPGRPTTTVHAHPAGPVALVLDLRHGDWRLGTCAVDGVIDILATGQHDGARPDDLLAALSTRVHAAAGPLGHRLVGIGVAVPGPTAENRLVHATLLGWRDVDLSVLPPSPHLPLVTGNDATMAAVAEARLHTPRPRTLLHVVVEIGIGGALVVDGRPVPSARGLHGEFGHLPFGAPDDRCPCGALGCWTASFDARQIARRAGLRVRRDPRSWLHRLFTGARPSPEARRAREDLAANLGRGVAGLVNALDPDVVTLGGLAPELRAASPDGFTQAVRSGLMTLHRDRPPAILAALSGEDAPLIGAGLSVFDHVLDAGMLARWAAQTGAVPS